MATENITKFFDAAMTEKALADKVAALATENGYDFTAEELREFGLARPLSDEETKNAFGGKKLNRPTQKYPIDRFRDLK